MRCGAALQLEPGALASRVPSRGQAPSHHPHGTLPQPWLLPASLGALQAGAHVGQHEAEGLVDGHEHHVVAAGQGVGWGTVQ